MNVTLNYSIAEIIKLTGGKLLARNDSLPAPKYLLLDSRKAASPSDTIFCALKTSARDGGSFVTSLYERGVRHFLIDHRKTDTGSLKNANVILVKNTTTALQKLATAHRKRYSVLSTGNEFPVIGITGSNGKTIVKEWLAHLLADEFSIAKNPGSYNSQIGVPLSVLTIEKSHNLGIFEAGVSTSGEMQKLEKILRPTIGVLTNIREAHREGFANDREKVREKLSLFIHSKHLVYCSDNILLKKEVLNFKKESSRSNPRLVLFSWGKKVGNDLRIISIARKENTTTITGINNGETHAIHIPFTDDASVENAITCWALLIVLKKNGEKILQKFSSLYPISMRLELKRGMNNCTIINDSYSTDLYSLSIALEFLVHQKPHKRCSVILSDILQSGQNSAMLYGEVATLLMQKKIYQFIGIGREIFASKKLFADMKSCQFYHSVQEFLQDQATLQFKDQNILVKGARSFGFEQIVSVLEQKAHQTVLSIDLKAIAHNLKFYKQLLPASTKIMGMVKAFSYGSGSHEIATALEYNGIDYLAVAYADEGVELKKAGIITPVMIMNVEKTTFPSIINYALEPEIFSFSMLHEFGNFIKSNGIKNYPIHLKIDTGMHRLGFTQEDLAELIPILSGNFPFVIKSVFTHLVASEDARQDKFTKYQIQLFKDCCGEIRSALKYDFYKHVANTAAIGRHRNAPMDMVRLGIGLYGIDQNSKIQKKLNNVSTLTTTISQIKNVKAGETVSYGRTAKLHRESIIATVRIGYADGYPRSLGNGTGKMLIRNKLVPVVGNVCMDMTMLDITDLHGVQEGDDVTVFGKKLPLPLLAEWAKTIPYEIMTGISQRVKRVYFEE